MRTPLWWLVVTLCAVAGRAAHAQSDSSAQRFVLDYDVPESPAFVALGVAPTTVTRGSAAKPLIAHIVNDIRSGQRLAGGVAIDAAPYFLFGGRLQNIREYRQSALKRVLANLLLSVATVQSQTDTSDLRLAVGIRATLLDSHDQLLDPTLSAEIDSALMRAAHVQAANDTQEVGQAVQVADLSEAYRRAKERLRSKPGDALSVGWAVAGLVHGSVATADSVGHPRHRVWGSYQHTFAAGMDAAATLQWVQADSTGSGLLAGVSLRANAAGSNLAVEVYYDSKPGRIGLGASGEVRLMRGVGLMVSIATQPTIVAGQATSMLKVRTSLRWDMNGEP